MLLSKRAVLPIVINCAYFLVSVSGLFTKFKYIKFIIFQLMGRLNINICLLSQYLVSSPRWIEGVLTSFLLLLLTFAVYF